MKNSRIRTHDPEDPVHVYYSNQYDRGGFEVSERATVDGI